MILADKVRELNKSDDGSKQYVRTKGKGIREAVLQAKNILSKHDDCQWDIMSGAQPG